MSPKNPKMNSMPFKSELISNSFYKMMGAEVATRVPARSQAEKKFNAMTDNEKFELLADRHRFLDQNKLTHLGIIDYLTRYTFAKKVER